MVLGFAFVFYLLVWCSVFVPFARSAQAFGRNIVIIVTLFWVLWYQWLSPLSFVLWGDTELFGFQSAPHLPSLLLIYGFSVIWVFIGWAVIKGSAGRDLAAELSLLDYPVWVCRVWIASGFLGLLAWAVSVNYSLSSLFLLSLWSGAGASSNMTSGSTLAMYSLQTFEFAITGILLASLSKMGRKEWLFWLTLYSVCAVSLGFRYRLMILGGGLGLIYVVRNGLHLRNIVPISGVLVITLILLTVFADNRTNFKAATRHQEQLNFSAGIDNVLSIFSNTRNFFADAALIKAVDTNQADIDFGETMFGHIVVRALPASVFDGVKPYPPSLEASRNSWPSSEGAYSGEAFSYVGEFYFTGGWFGVAILSLLFGMALRWASRVRSPLLIIVISASIFQYVGRGYLPGFMMSFVFLLVPAIISVSKPSKGIQS